MNDCKYQFEFFGSKTPHNTELERIIVECDSPALDIHAYAQYCSRSFWIQLTIQLTRQLSETFGMDITAVSPKIHFYAGHIGKRTTDFGKIHYMDITLFSEDTYKVTVALLVKIETKDETEDYTEEFTQDNITFSIFTTQDFKQCNFRPNRWKSTLIRQLGLKEVAKGKYEQLEKPKISNKEIMALESHYPDMFLKIRVMNTADDIIKQHVMDAIQNFPELERIHYFNIDENFCNDKYICVFVDFGGNDPKLLLDLMNYLKKEIPEIQKITF